MRPNIDISHALNGQVEDYAETKGSAFDEAYREIIERGLEAVDHPGEP